MSNPDYLTVRQVRRIKDGRLPAANINTPEFSRYAIRNEDLCKLIVASTRRVEVVGDVIEFIK